jgi:xanthine dehydrogenase molybdopterin-binding subunit B
VAEVTVDPETGIVRPEKIWIAHDVGRSINPSLVTGQVEGSVYMGLGEALMEEMTYRDSARSMVHHHPSMLEYKSPTTLEMCDVVTYLVGKADNAGPFGAKEAGQGPLLPVMPAVANAIYDAVGVRVDEVPCSPHKVLRALKEKMKGREPRFGPAAIPHYDFPEAARVLTPEQGGNGRELDGREHSEVGGAELSRSEAAARPGARTPDEP